MIHLPEYLTKDFSSKKEFLHYIKDNKEDILSLKKSEVYKSYEKGAGVRILNSSNVLYGLDKSSADKSLHFPQLEEGYIYPIINSTSFLDSHLDVHIKGCYNRTVKHQQGKVYLIDTHLKGLANILTRKDNIEMFYQDVSWKLLGKDYEGKVEVLMFKIKNDAVREDALDFIKATPDLECSLAMQYMNIDFACKSNDPAFKEENELYKEYYSQVANKDELDKWEVMFLVKELAIRGEGSICPVVGGSNSATRVVNFSKDTSSENTHKVDPTIVTQTSEPIDFVAMCKQVKFN